MRVGVVMFQRVVVPVDGSEVTLGAAIVGSRIAASVNGTLELVEVVDRTATRALARVAHSTPHTTVVIDGGSRARPRALMQEFCGPLVVVGPRCDVDAEEAPAGTYVVALDGSIGDEGVIPVVAAWTMEFGGTPWLVDVDRAMVVRARPDVVDSAYVNHRAGRLRRRIGCDVEHETLHGDHPARAIVEFAGDAAASLIFVGTDADSRLGATPARIARRPDRPARGMPRRAAAPAEGQAVAVAGRQAGRGAGSAGVVAGVVRAVRTGCGQASPSASRYASHASSLKHIRSTSSTDVGRGAQRVDRDRRRLVERVAVDPRRDRGEGDRADAEFVRPRQRLAVARREQLGLAESAAAPHRADRVDHPARGQPEPGRGLRLAGPATAQPAAVLDELRPGRTVDRSVDTSTAEQRRVGGVDDGVDVLAGDVAAHEAQDGRRHRPTLPLRPQVPPRRIARRHRAIPVYRASVPCSPVPGPRSRVLTSMRQTLPSPILSVGPHRG